MLTVDVAKIPHEGLELNTPFEAAHVHLAGETGFSLDGPGHLAGRLDRGDDETLHLRGRVQVRLGLECSRCLERFSLSFDQELDLFYLPHAAGARQEDEQEDEVELSDRDMVVAYYRGQQLDLGELLREQFYLAVPMKRLCREDCRGLCPTCGANGNSDGCACPPAADVDPRLGVLAQLLDKGAS